MALSLRPDTALSSTKPSLSEEKPQKESATEKRTENWVGQDRTVRGGTGTAPPSYTLQDKEGGNKDRTHSPHRRRHRHHSRYTEDGKRIKHRRRRGSSTSSSSSSSSSEDEGKRRHGWGGRMRHKIKQTARRSESTSSGSSSSSSDDGRREKKHGWKKLNWSILRRN